MKRLSIAKKEEKIKYIFSKMKDKNDEEEFKRIFIENYPQDWKFINKKYNYEKNKDVKGKGFPMPKPYTYLHNMYQIYKKTYLLLQQNDDSKKD